MNRSLFAGRLRQGISAALVFALISDPVLGAMAPAASLSYRSSLRQSCESIYARQALNPREIVSPLHEIKPFVKARRQITESTSTLNLGLSPKSKGILPGMGVGAPLVVPLAPAAVPRERLKVCVTLFGTPLEIREGGDFSIDITRAPVPTKKDAMEDFLQTNDIKASRGIYIGNENASEESRDGIMTQIDGLRVLAVDEQSSRVVKGAEWIGKGPDAALKKINELLALPAKDLPRFVGLDVDGTLLGLRASKNKRVKESFLRDRTELGEALLDLAQRGVYLIFFTDNDSKLARSRIGEDLTNIARKNGTGVPIEFTLYASGMVTKNHVSITSDRSMTIEEDKAYQRYLIPAQVAQKLKKIIGEVEETSNGLLQTDLLGDYYKRLAEKGSSGEYELRKNLRSHYPGFTATPLPAVQLRDEQKDGRVAQVSIVPVASAFLPGSTISAHQPDERSRLLGEIINAIQALKQDEALLDEHLDDRTLITESLLEHFRKLLGVGDLVANQRLPDDPEAAIARAKGALNTVHRKLAQENLDIETISQNEFNRRFGTQTFITAGGQATRFSRFIHKTLARVGLIRTNIGFALEGSYSTPGVKPVIMVSDKSLGLFVKDNHIADYDPASATFKVNSKVVSSPNFKLIPLNWLDPEKVRQYLGKDPSEVEVVYYGNIYGHGYALAGTLDALPEKLTAPYIQMAFGEMSPAVLSQRSNASFITYLEILSEDAYAVAGGKQSKGEFEGKGHFMFNGDGRELLTYTDWEQIPHEVAKSENDLVAKRFARAQREMEKALGQWQGSSSRDPNQLDKLKQENPYFVISSHGQLFSQEEIRRVVSEIKRWNELSEEAKKEIRQHFAVWEDASRRKADLLISSNSAIFRSDVVRGLFPEIERLFKVGHFDHYGAEVSREPNLFWGVEPKNNEAKSLAWNLIRLISAHAPADHRRIGFAYVGNAPSSIKDVHRQFEFARLVPPEFRLDPSQARPSLSTSEITVVQEIHKALNQQDDAQVDNLLRGLLPPRRASDVTFHPFRRVVAAVLFDLGALSRPPRNAHSLMMRVLGKLGDGTGAVRRVGGVVDQLLAEAVDGGYLHPELSDEAQKLFEKFERDLKDRQAKKPDEKVEEYLAARMDGLRPSNREKIKKRREDLIAIFDGNEASLDRAIEKDWNKNKYSFEVLINEDRLPTLERNGRPRAQEAPEAILFEGGSSGRFGVSVIPEIVVTTPPTREVKLNTIVALAPTDDGGSTRQLMDQLGPYLGPILPPGDEMNVMAGATTAHKRAVIRARLDQNAQGSMKKHVIDILNEAMKGNQEDGTPIDELKHQPLDEDWITFCHHLLAATELMDSEFYSQSERHVTLGETSIGNMLNVAMKVREGAYSEKTKQIDGVKYAFAMGKILNILGIPDIHIEPTTFERGTLYALLESPSITIDGKTRVLDKKTIDESMNGQPPIQLDGASFRLGRDINGGLMITINGETATLTEEFGSAITRHEPPQPGDSKTEVIIQRGHEEPERRILDTTGTGINIKLGNKDVLIKGRLLIEQTWITDRVHSSPIVKLGLINNFKAPANARLIELIRNTQDMLVFGPGSFSTSLLPQLMSPELVDALIQRRKAGLPTVFVANPLLDNETVDFNFKRVIQLIEDISGHRFQDIFSSIVVNDLVAGVRLKLSGEGADQQDKTIQMIRLTNEMAEKQLPAIAADRPATAPSKVAKYSRGVLGATENERRELMSLVELGGIPSDFQFAGITELLNDMRERSVTVYLRPMLTLIERHARKTGGAEKPEEAVGYNPQALGEVLDDILLASSLKWPEYNDLLEVFGRDPQILETEVKRMMRIYPDWIRRKVLDEMHRWWILKDWPDHTALFKSSDFSDLELPRIIISNVAFTLLWLDKNHRPIPIQDRLARAMNHYLETGGIWIILSGLDHGTMDQLILNRIRPDLRHRVILAPSSGTEAWVYNKSGELQEKPLLSYEAFVPKAVRDRMYAIVKKVYKEFGLDQPLYSQSGQLIDGAVPILERESLIAIEAAQRTNLRSGLVADLNHRLEAIGLRDYQLERDERTKNYDIRTALQKRLRNLFKDPNMWDPKYNVAVALRGHGAVNCSIVIPQGVFEQKVVKYLHQSLPPSGSVLLFGLQKEEFTRYMPDAKAISFTLNQKTDQIPEGVQLYEGAPGPDGVAQFLEQLVSRRPHAAGALGIWEKLGITNRAAIGVLEGLSTLLLGTALLSHASASIAGWAFPIFMLVMTPAHYFYGIAQGWGRSPVKGDAILSVQASLIASTSLAGLPFLLAGFSAGHSLPGFLLSMAGLLLATLPHATLNRGKPGPQFQTQA